MLLLGLTGGIGTGKSTVAAMLRELGAVIVDADEGARAVVEPGTEGLRQIVAAFGSEFAPGGRLDRARLAELVFQDPDARRRLNQITHPLVREWAAARIQEAATAGAAVVVQDIPLLFESGLEGLFQGVILVYAPAGVQLERLRERGMAEPDARARMATQLPIEEKSSRARWVIDNSGTREQTRAQVERLWTEITAASGTGP